ncbi:MAG: aminotransferase class III-fold pyridoxal phosphate-dependent enzyme [Bacteroidia bacterium]|nr:aminotransferase class III-fold pyridoxal phosphate-dependent enzyme [Bacteroidia bacterium]
MHTFDVYPLYDIAPMRGLGCSLWDEAGQEYLDLYGGHAVISIGHTHPHYVRRVRAQLEQLGFYSNAVKNPVQEELAAKLGQLSGYEDYTLFLINSGAEAIENALKLASFHTGREKVAYLERSFHGRTSAAVMVTDNAKIQAPVNRGHAALRVGFDNLTALRELLERREFCAVLIEGIQGVGGIYVPADAFLQEVRHLCDETGTVLILDEIQSGYGRTGRFFAHQHAGIRADLITVAKGMGNGFPIGGVLIGPQFTPWHGMLGTTFGGNHLACAAALAVLEVIQDEHLIAHAAEEGAYLMEALRTLPHVRDVRGRGLMIGVELDIPATPVRDQLLHHHHMFTGSAGAHVIRLLPPLTLTRAQSDVFLGALAQTLTTAPVAHA